MTMQLKLIISAIFMLIFAGGVSWHLAGDRSTEKALDEAIAEAVKSRGEIAALKDQISTLSIQRAELETKLTDVEKTRARINKELASTISKLTAQRIPDNCTKAVEFAIEHKDDLKW